MKNMKRSTMLILAALLIILIPGCNKSAENEGSGRLVISLTDAPFPFSMIESATVTITKVEIRKAGDGVPDGNPFLVIWEGSEIFNLLDLRNGLKEELLDIEIPSGEYDLIRLYVEEAGLKIKDGDDFSLKIPSGKQTGIKVFVNPGLIIEGGLTSELLLDFDLSRSFVMQGNYKTPAGIKGFHFKPVIRAVNNTTAGRLEGMVTDTLKVKIKEASVWVARDSIVASTVADTLGHFVIIGLPGGIYSVFAAKEKYDTVKIDGVKIVPGNKTVLNIILPSN
jgi:hypothetical protein